MALCIKYINHHSNSFLNFARAMKYPFVTKNIRNARYSFTMAERSLFVKLQVLLLVLATLVTLSSTLNIASDETKSSEEPDSKSHTPAQKKEDHNRYFGDGSPGEIKTGDQNQRDPTIGLFFKRDKETWLGNLKKRCRRKTNSNCMRKDHRRQRK